MDLCKNSCNCLSGLSSETTTRGPLFVFSSSLSRCFESVAVYCLFKIYKNSKTFHQSEKYHIIIIDISTIKMKRMISKSKISLVNLLH